MRETARRLDELRWKAQVGTLAEGALHLTRTLPLKERLSGLSVPLLSLGPLLGYIPEATLACETKQAKPSQRMILCFMNGIVACKEREGGVLSVKAEYHVTTFNLKVIDSHQFVIIAKESNQDADMYTAMNTDCKNLLSSIYSSDICTISHGGLSPPIRRNRLLTNMLKPTSRDRMFSATRSKLSPQKQQLSSVASTAHSPSNALVYSITNNLSSTLDDKQNYDSMLPLDVRDICGENLNASLGLNEFTRVQQRLHEKLAAMSAVIKQLVMVCLCLFLLFCSIEFPVSYN